MALDAKRRRPRLPALDRVLGCFAVLMLLPAGWGGALAAADPFADMDVRTPRIRLDAPSFTLPDLDGRPVRLSDFRGKVVLLNFWATWCAPCLEEMPDMQALWEQRREEGFVILAVAADRGSRGPVAAFTRKLALTFPVLLDPDGDVRNRYEVAALPMSYLIGRDGRISGRVIGSKAWASREAFTLIDHLLRQQSSQPPSSGAGPASPPPAD